LQNSRSPQHDVAAGKAFIYQKFKSPVSRAGQTPFCDN
jgi:hypothetical protein